MPSRKRKQEEEEAEDIEVDEAPTSINPYDVLSVSTDATADQIKSAYRKAALKYHPDKASAEDKDSAHTKFQEVAFAYAILSDERRKQRYDTSGRTEECLDEDDDFEWADFFREQYQNVVNGEAIEKFAREYKGSEEERRHVLAAYKKCKGDLNRIFEEVMLSDPIEDEPRFSNIIDAAIEAGEMEKYDMYLDESIKTRQARVKKAKKARAREAKEAKKAATELEEDADSKKRNGAGKASNKNDGDMGGLAALIQQRQKGRAENFFDSLEAKYAAPKGSKKGAKRASPMDEPSEEAFANNREHGKAKKAKR